MPTAGSLQEIAGEHTKIHAKGKGANTKFTCNHCNKEFTGSQTRQLAHLTGTSGSGVAACHALIHYCILLWAMCNGLRSFSTFPLFQPHPAKSRCGGARTGCGTAPAPAPARVQLCLYVKQYRMAVAQLSKTVSGSWASECSGMSQSIFAMFITANTRCISLQLHPFTHRNALCQPARVWLLSTTAQALRSACQSGFEAIAWPLHTHGMT